MSSDLIKIEKSTGDDCGVMAQSSHYPWGTTLNFENDLVDKLGIGALQPGDVVEVRGYAIVESVSESADTKDSRKSVGLQLTEIKVGRKQNDNDYAKQLYGGQS